MPSGSPKKPAGTTIPPAPDKNAANKYSWDRPSYKASCIPKGILLSTESGLSGERQVESSADELLKKQCDVDKLLHEADIAQFEMTAHPQHWVGKYYMPAASGAAPRGSKSSTKKESETTQSGTKDGRSPRRAALPSPRQHKLRDAVADKAELSSSRQSVPGGTSSGEASGSNRVPHAQQMRWRNYTSPSTNNLAPPTNHHSSNGSGADFRLEPSEGEAGHPPPTAEAAEKWKALSARRTAGDLFVDDLEYQAKEYMRDSTTDEGVAYVFPLDDQIIAVFGGSVTIAKEVFEKSGALHYSSVPGAEILVADEIFHRKSNRSAQLQKSGNDVSGGQGPSEGEGGPEGSKEQDGDAVEDDLWYAIPKTSPIGVQKVAAALREHIHQHIKDAEAALREELSDA